MFANIIPKFGKGRILKKEMLENLRDYPRSFAEIYFGDYSNGIVSGADIRICESTIIVKKGIVKHGNRLYMLEQEFEIPYHQTNTEVLIKIRFGHEKSDSDYVSFCSDVFIDENTTVGDNELELGRFKLREGAILRSEYVDFYDFSTEYNTINVINVEYAGVRKSTINPSILDYFANIIMRNSIDNVLDIAFAMECLNTTIVEREAILCYISNRLDIDYKDHSNLHIYKYLTQIVRETEGKRRRKADMPTGPSRIIVD